LTRGLAPRLVARSGPGGRAGAPLGAGGGIAQAPQGRARGGQAQHLGPRRGAPGGPRAVSPRSGAARRWWIATAQVLPQLGAVADVGADAEARVHHRRDHGRAPARPATPRRARPLGHAGGEGGVRRRGAVGRAAGGLGAWCPVAAIGPAPASPRGDGRLRHAPDRRARREPLAFPDGADGQPRRDLASVALGLSLRQAAFHGLTGVGGEGTTDAAQRDSPPKTP
jgi:hypothetical protein